MDVLLVSYDLNTPGKDYSGLLNVIHSFEWRKVGGSAYAVWGPPSAYSLFTVLQRHIDANDTLMVLPIKPDFFARSSQELADWLTARVR